MLVSSASATHDRRRAPTSAHCRRMVDQPQNHSMKKIAERDDRPVSSVRCVRTRIVGWQPPETSCTSFLPSADRKQHPLGGVLGEIRVADNGRNTFGRDRRRCSGRTIAGRPRLQRRKRRPAGRPHLLGNDAVSRPLGAHHNWTTAAPTHARQPASISAAMAGASRRGAATPIFRPDRSHAGRHRHGHGPPDRHGRRPSERSQRHSAHGLELERRELDCSSAGAEPPGRAAFAQDPPGARIISSATSPASSCTTTAAASRSTALRSSSR